jgi:hypothetical protein
MFYYLRRIQHLGFKKSIHRIESFFERQAWNLYWKCRRTLRRPITYAKKHSQLVQTKHLSFFLHHPLLKKELVLLNPIREHNQNTLTLCQEKKAFLFNQLISLDDQEKWQKDLLYNRFISLKSVSNKEQESESGEIRIAWELSRFHHLFWAALMAHEDKELSNKKVIKDFIIAEILDWQTRNPFMTGIHWYNAMEVAIRATNLIFIASLLETELKEKELWQTIINILYQHKLFIQSHWETSATPNNHYLADLIGYGHLLLFFNHSNKEIKQHLSKTISAFKTQLFADGWAYEGSTGYHRLDTELLLHLTILTQWTDHPDKKEVDHLFSEALKQLTILQGRSTLFPSIGDNDEGKLLTGLHISPNISTEIINHFPEMGISIITKNKIDLIMRHAKFDQKSPTGHYHRDDLSFILSWQGIPLFIDPGSGMYTGNKTLRRQMRAWDAHNTVFCKDELLADQHEELFQLTKKKWDQQPIIIHNPNEIKIISKRPLYCTKGIIIRSIRYAEKMIEITDQIISEYQHPVENSLIINPSIDLIKKNEAGTCWSLFHKDQESATLRSQMPWQQEEFQTTESFGTLKKCQRLRSTYHSGQNITITFHSS